MAKVGRPDSYNTELGIEVCCRLSERSMVSVCQDADMPSRQTVYQWIARHPEFADMYARCTAERGQYRAEKIEDISEKVLTGEYDPQAARVAIDGFKWTAAKLAPKKYGDKISIGGDADNPLTLLIREISGSTLRPGDDT